MNDERWFDGRVDGGPEAAAFLSRVRELAPAALGDRLTADATSAVPDGCIITADVPGVPASEWLPSTASRAGVNSIAPSPTIASRGDPSGSGPRDG